MFKKKFLIVLAVVFVIIAAATVVSATEAIKTHEYNYADKAFFNISDDLTNETGFETSLFDSLEGGTFYTYPDGESLCSLYIEGEDAPEDFNAHQNDSSYEKIEGNNTSQGYKTYIFKDSGEYTVFVDLDNLTVQFKEGYDAPYYYFVATFKTMDEAQIFIDTFKINETSVVS